MRPSSWSRISTGISNRRRTRNALLLQHLAEGTLGTPIRHARRDLSDAPGLDRPAAAHSDQRAAGRPGGVLLHRDHRRRLHPAVHHAGRRRPDFRPDGAHLCLCAGRRAAGDLHRHAVPGVAACRRSTSAKWKRSWCGRLRSVYTPVLRWSLRNSRITIAIGLAFLVVSRFPGLAARQRIPADARGRQSMDSRHDAADHIAGGRHADRQRNPRNPAAPSRSHHGGVAARPSRRRQRRRRLLQCGILRAAEAVRRWPRGYQGQADQRPAGRFNKEFVGIDFNFSQYIQDNVEEGLSGVKGANSVKIIGPDLATLEKLAGGHGAKWRKVQGITDLGVFWVLGQPNLNIRVDRQGGALWLKCQRRQYRRSGGAGRHHGDHAAGIRPAVRRRGAARPGISQGHRRRAQPQGRLSDAERAMPIFR